MERTVLCKGRCTNEWRDFRLTEQA